MGIRMHLGMLVTVALSAAIFAGQATEASDPSAPIDEAAFPQKIKVACVGDSITQGSGTTALPRPNRFLIGIFAIRDV